MSPTLQVGVDVLFYRFLVLSNLLLGFLGGSVCFNLICERGFVLSKCFNIPAKLPVVLCQLLNLTLQLCHLLLSDALLISGSLLSLSCEIVV